MHFSLLLLIFHQHTKHQETVYQCDAWLFIDISWVLSKVFIYLKCQKTHIIYDIPLRLFAAFLFPQEKCHFSFERNFASCDDYFLLSKIISKKLLYAVFVSKIIVSKRVGLHALRCMISAGKHPMCFVNIVSIHSPIIRVGFTNAFAIEVMQSSSMMMIGRVSYVCIIWF